MASINVPTFILVCVCLVFITLFCSFSSLTLLLKQQVGLQSVKTDFKNSPRLAIERSV